MSSKVRSRLSGIDRFFRITERRSSIRVEAVAGLTTFLSLSYIFVIHPVILESAGFSVERVLAATIITSVIVTWLSGLWTRLPFVFAPGLEMSIYISFVTIPLFKFTSAQALGMVLVSGVIVGAISFRRIKHALVDSIPHHFPNAVALVMAAFLLTISLKLMGFTDYPGGFLHLTFRVNSDLALIGLGCTLLITLLEILSVKPSVLLSVLVVSLLYRKSMGETLNSGVFNVPNGFLQLPEITSWMSSFAAWSTVFSLFILSCYGSLSKLINLSKGTTIEDIHGALPGVRRIFAEDALASVVGSVLGTTTVTTFVESGAGITAGGRTGLTAIFAGAFMILGAFLLPFIKYVPMTASVGALIYVGFLFIPRVDFLKAFHRTDAILTAVMVLIVITTLSLGLAFLVGFLGFVLNEFWLRSKLDNGAST